MFHLIGKNLFYYSLIKNQIMFPATVNREKPSQSWSIKENNSTEKVGPVFRNT